MSTGLLESGGSIGTRSVAILITGGGVCYEELVELAHCSEGIPFVCGVAALQTGEGVEVPVSSVGRLQDGTPI